MGCKKVELGELVASTASTSWKFNLHRSVDDGHFVIDACLIDSERILRDANLGRERRIIRIPKQFQNDATPLIAANRYELWATGGPNHAIFIVDERNLCENNHLSFHFPSTIIQITAAGERMHCLLENGNLYSIGKGSHGELGLGEETRETKGFMLNNSLNKSFGQVLRVFATDFYSIAVTETGRILGWGWKLPETIKELENQMIWEPRVIVEVCDPSTINDLKDVHEILRSNFSSS